MPLVRDQAVVLMRLDYSETSQIVVFFTRQHGKVRAIAKGVKRGTKKRFAVGLDLLEIGEMVFTHRSDGGGGLATMTEWKPARPLPGLRERLDRLHAAEYAAEVTGHLTEDGDPHQELFDALVAALHALSTSTQPIDALVTYQWRLLEACGLQPRLDDCILCGRTRDLTYFSSHAGGMICRHCEPGQIEKWEVAPLALEHVRRGSAPDRDDSQSAATAVEPVDGFALLNYHISHCMGKEPRLASKINSTQRRAK